MNEALTVVLQAATTMVERSWRKGKNLAGLCKAAVIICTHMQSPPASRVPLNMKKHSAPTDMEKTDLCQLTIKELG